MYKKLIIKIILLSLSFLYLHAETSNIENAYMLYRSRNYIKSAEMLEYEIKNSPVLKIEYFETLADVYMKLSNYNRMLKVANEGIMVNRYSSKLYFQKGYAFYKLGDTNQAIASMEKSITLNPTSAYTHNFVGLLYLYEDNFKQAESYFLKATVYNPLNLLYLKNLGATYERQRNYADALQSYERSYKINPNYRGLNESLERVRKVLSDGNITSIPPSETEINELKEQQLKSIEDWSVKSESVQD